MPAMVGRENELELIAGFLDQTARGPAAVIIRGEAGMGKSTVWREGVETARRRALRVLQCEPVQAEASLAYVAVADLIDPAADRVLPHLARPQATALERVLVRTSARTSRPDRRTVSLAILNAVRLLAAEQPLVLAVDDAEWLDAGSAGVLEFVLRRLRSERVGLLVTSGTDAPAPLPGIEGMPRWWRVELPPLSASEVDELLSARCEHALDGGALERVRALSGGNPFIALEVATSIERSGDAGCLRRPLAIPARLRPLLRRRMAVLSSGARRVLLLVAALPSPRLGTVVAALPPSAERAVHEALDQGLLEESEGLLRTRHPLLGEALYAECPRVRRRSVHRRLARIVDDCEERARHLALASAAPNAAVADAMDRAVRSALDRGAPEAAAALAEEAARFTPGTRAGRAVRWALDAALLHFEAGNTPRARQVLAQVLASSPPAARASALLQRAVVECQAAGPARAVGTLREAHRQAAHRPDIRAAVHEARCWADVLQGDLRSAERHAAAALRLAASLGREDLLATATAAVAATRCYAGRGVDGCVVSRLRSVDERASGRAAAGRARIATGAILAAADQCAAARELHLAEYERSRRRGDRATALVTLVCLALDELQVGRWDDAFQHAAAACGLAASGGLTVTRSIALGTRARIEAVTGRVSSARATAAEAIHLARQAGSPVGVAIAAGARGLLELSLGDPAAARAAMIEMDGLIDTAGITEPGWVVFWFVPDQVEALVELGDLDRAEAMLQAFEERARALDRASAMAGAWRCRSRMEAARGHLTAAVAAAERALVQHERSGQPFERGRTLLLLGRLLRRTKRKRQARETLASTVDLFERLGAPLWADRARADLARVGRPAPRQTGALTCTEERVAQLAAAGKTDREIARALFLSVRTVGVNLSRVYQKLGFRSRTELAVHLAATRNVLSDGEGVILRSWRGRDPSGPDPAPA